MLYSNALLLMSLTSLSSVTAVGPEKVHLAHKAFQSSTTQRPLAQMALSGTPAIKPVYF